MEGGFGIIYFLISGFTVILSGLTIAREIELTFYTICAPLVAITELMGDSLLVKNSFLKKFHFGKWLKRYLFLTWIPMLYLIFSILAIYSVGLLK